MSIISRMRRQKAVYWAKFSVDNYGNPVLSSPVEIDCRWDDTTTKFIGGGSIEEKLSRATVYVDREVSLGGYLWKGVLSSAPTDPILDDLAFEILHTEEIPNLRATEFLRIAKL